MRVYKWTCCVLILAILLGGFNTNSGLASAQPGPVNPGDPEDEFMLDNFPSTFEVFSPIRFTFPVATTPVSLESFTFEIRFIHYFSSGGNIEEAHKIRPIIQDISGENNLKCYISFDGDAEQYPVLSYSVSSGGVTLDMSQSISHYGPMRVIHVDCPYVQLVPYAYAPVEPLPVTMHIDFTSPGFSTISQHPVQVVSYNPTIKHQFYWVPYTSRDVPQSPANEPLNDGRLSSSPIDPQSGTIAVKYTVFIPEPDTERREIIINHPLLGFPEHSFHLGEEEGTPSTSSSLLHADLLELYHLTPPQGDKLQISCSPRTSAPNGVRHLASTIEILSFTSNRNTKLIRDDGDIFAGDYRCVFTLHYPPDVLSTHLYRIRKEANSSNDSQFVIINVGDMEYYTTIELPDQIPIGWGTPGEPTHIPRVFVWTSPRHHPGALDAIEFSLAFSKSYINTSVDNARPIAFSQSPSHYRASLESTLPGSSLYPPSSPSFLPQQDPQPQPFHCYRHDALADGYRHGTLIHQSLPFPTFTIPLSPFLVFGGHCALKLDPYIEQLDHVTLAFGTLLDGQPFPSVSAYPFITVFDSMHRVARPPYLEIGGFQSVPPSSSPLFPDGSAMSITNYQSPVIDSSSDLSTISYSIDDPIPLIVSEWNSGGDGASSLHWVSFEQMIQYLPYRGSTRSENRMHLHLVFYQLTATSEIAPANEDYVAELSIVSHGIPIYNRDDVPIDFIDVQFASHPANLDIISQLLIPHHPVRSPTVIIPLDIPLDSTQPIHVNIQFPIGSRAPSHISVYAFLAPGVLSQMNVFTPQFAMFSAIRSGPSPTPGFRCVSWDNLVAPYVYHANILDQANPLTLTDETSIECPQIHHPVDAVPLVKNDVGGYWKRTYYDRWDSTKVFVEHMCLYQLGAVCVVESGNQPGLYYVQPLSECQSILSSSSSFHAIPCSMLRDDPVVDYRTSMNIPSRHSLSTGLGVGWQYLGDPRLNLAFSVRALTSDDLDGPITDEAFPWIPVASEIPAYISPSFPDPSGPQFTLMLPFFDPNVVQTQVMMKVEMLPDGVSWTILHSSVEPSDNTAGCLEEQFKMYDPHTHLCTCQPGFMSDVPSGIDNPFIHPNDFTCVARCHQGFVWNPDTEQCECVVDGKSCMNYGVCNPSTMQCTCFDGYFGEACQYDDEDDIDYVCEQLECVAEHVVDDDDDDDANECKIDVDVDDNNTTTVVCNCAGGFTGDQCQHQAVCGVRQCVNGRLVSPTGKPEECKCECNSTNITGSACNQCTLQCRNGGVANTRCTACQCPAGYIGTTCTIPVWYHTFTLRNLPQHIVELILGTTASDKEQMAILQQTMVKYLLEDYSRVLSETFIVVDGNGNGGNPDGNDNDTRIRVRVELSQFQTVIPPANPNAPYVHIQLMLYPADMTEEMLAYALQHGLDFDWSRVTDNLEFFRKFLREQGIIDDSNDDDALTPEIIDPGCTTRECREQIIDEESSNHALPIFTSALASTLSLCLVAMLSLFYL